MYIAMIQAAQASGSLVTAFDNIHDYEHRRRDFQRRLTSAMAYPMVLVTVAFLATLFLVSFVVPRISAVLISAGGELPVTTRILISVSDVASRYWYVVIIVVGGRGICAEDDKVVGARTPVRGQGDDTCAAGEAVCQVGDSGEICADVLLAFGDGSASGGGA